MEVSQTTNTTVLLKWVAAFDGNAKIMFFTVTYNISGGQTAENIDPNTFEFVAKNLEPATVYKFQVTATNELGTSESTFKFAITHEAGQIKLIVFCLSVCLSVCLFVCLFFVCLCCFSA